MELLTTSEENCYGPDLIPFWIWRDHAEIFTSVRLVYINSHNNISQRSWVQILYGHEIFTVIISTTSSIVFIAARISNIRFFAAVHIYDFHISTIIRANCLGDLTHITNVPSVRQITTAMSALTTVGTHLVGSIIHNGQAQNGKEIYGSFDYYQYPHDSNLTMTVLLEVLVRWSEEFDLPPILYLQFDNCVRENKNRYMFALLALLVEDKIFIKYLILGNFKRNAFASFTLPTRYFVQASKCHIAMFSSSIWVGS